MGAVSLVEDAEERYADALHAARVAAPEPTPRRRTRPTRPSYVSRYAAVRYELPSVPPAAVAQVKRELADQNPDAAALTGRDAWQAGVDRHPPAPVTVRCRDGTTMVVPHDHFIRLSETTEPVAAPAEPAPPELASPEPVAAPAVTAEPAPPREPDSPLWVLVGLACIAVRQFARRRGSS